MTLGFRQASSLAIQAFSARLAKALKAVSKGITKANSVGVFQRGEYLQRLGSPRQCSSVCSAQAAHLEREDAGHSVLFRTGYQGARLSGAVRDCGVRCLYGLKTHVKIGRF